MRWGFLAPPAPYSVRALDDVPTSACLAGGSAMRIPLFDAAFRAGADVQGRRVAWFDCPRKLDPHTSSPSKRSNPPSRRGPCCRWDLSAPMQLWRIMQPSPRVSTVRTNSSISTRPRSTKRTLQAEAAARGQPHRDKGAVVGGHQSCGPCCGRAGDQPRGIDTPVATCGHYELTHRLHAAGQLLCQRQRRK